MMQKVINVIALLSGLTSLAVIGGGVYLYKNADVMIEDVRKNVANAAVEAITDALPGMLDAAMPELPEVTGPEIPMATPTPSAPTTTGPAIPLP
tara:strand:- start:615 stop:896 length:282 start_codon:yes stop_codon:yes gene_type:complete